MNPRSNTLLIYHLVLIWSGLCQNCNQEVKAVKQVAFLVEKSVDSANKFCVLVDVRGDGQCFGLHWEVWVLSPQLY